MRHKPSKHSVGLQHLAKYRDALARNLALLPLNNRRKMEITFLIMLGSGIFMDEDGHHELYFLNMLSAIRNMVYDLRKHGSEVKGYAMMRMGERVDVSQLFPLSSEEWREVCYTKLLCSSLC